MIKLKFKAYNMSTINKLPIIVNHIHWKSIVNVLCWYEAQCFSDKKCLEWCSLNWFMCIGHSSHWSLQCWCFDMGGGEINFFGVVSLKPLVVRNLSIFLFCRKLEAAVYSPTKLSTSKFDWKKKKQIDLCKLWKESS